jgi:hypothetical protein
MRRIEKIGLALLIILLAPGLLCLLCPCSLTGRGGSSREMATPTPASVDAPAPTGTATPTSSGWETSPIATPTGGGEPGFGAGGRQRER